ncbi:LysR family transcriptional regulator [Pseudonocardia asaccharolytica]|uniref:LysR family transcriptional regulator n=1 Tax=Pseudonocardia asaccharolytica DSM 44247 = NBRC 16224 TaxID=1123024 RepID=A0A511D3Z3_9PSEU|nr:LysR family transcriptional regulator [Pseudonocardia asaccharolytica]GEL19509.1 LysR family transcriptional regulator [Pseudonocardia asaccharolytica DSM 44247 = NBRC 16224]
MDVQRLRILRELADRGSVAAVAKAMSFTPSAISQQLKTLADETGMALTEPAGRGLRLTDAGQALVAEAEQVLAALAHAEAALDRLRSSPRGTVRVVLFPSGARLLLPGLLTRVVAIGDIDLVCRDVDMTPADVPALTADADIVVTHRDERSPAPDAGTPSRWTLTPLLREPLDVVLPPGHRLARRRTLRLADLTDEGWISVGVGWPVDEVLRSLAAATGAQPRIVQRINDFSVTEQLVAAGHGIALLPRYCTDDRGGRRLARRPLAGVRAVRLIEAVARRSTAVRPAVRAVLQALCEEAAAVVARGSRAGPAIRPGPAAR